MDTHLLRKYLAKHITYPLHERVKTQNTVCCYHRLKQNEARSADELDARQFESLRALIARAWEHSPYYRRRFEERGVRPEDIRTRTDLERLPFLTKSEVRSYRSSLLTVGKEDRGVVPFTTGGSTGMPLEFYVDRHYTANGWAACWRARSWWGLDWGDPWIWLWGSPIELSSGDRLKRWGKAARNFLLNRRLLSAYDMTDDTMARYIEILRRDGVRYIYAYADAAYLLADFVRRKGIDLRDHAPRVVFTTSCTLHGHMRRAIEDAFCCPVSNEYGSREASFIAHECPAGRMHIHTDRVHVEVVIGDRPAACGETGEIVVTVLDNTSAPFIRYRMGDMGSLSWDPCPCGLPFPVLHSVDGRLDDFLLGRENKLIYSGAMYQMLLDLHEAQSVGQFRVLQHDTDRLTIEIVPRVAGLPVPADRVRSGIQKLFGYPVQVDIRYVASLPVSRSGKQRAVISSLTRHYFEAETVPHPAP